MHVAVYLPLVLPLLAAVSARWLAWRLEPRMATWLLTGSALVLAAASGAALTILAATALGQVPLLAGAGHWSAAVMRRDDPTSLSYALVACGLLARRVTSDRRLVARTVGKAALLARARPGAPSAVLSIAAGTLRGTGHVPRRVAALLAAPPRRHPLLLAAMLTVLALAAGSALEAARDLHGLIQLAGGP